MELTGGRGPDGCIDAVGTEADVSSLDSIVDRAKVASYIGTDCPHVLREAIMCCRKRGTVSIPGVYIGVLDKIPFGAAMNKGLTLKMGQTHVQKYLEPLLVRSKLAKSTRRS
jgi:threonine dehydrogenase-like Zn-dependent dehydrogenase